MIIDNGKWSDGSRFCCEICVFEKESGIAVGAIYVTEISEKEMLERFPGLVPGEEAEVNLKDQDFISPYVEIDRSKFEYAVAYSAIAEDDSEKIWWRGKERSPFKII
jgi:hypothetical protein